MDIGDVYQNNVNKNPVIQTGISSGIPSTRERDPQQVKLEQDVFSKMVEVSQPQEQGQKKDLPNINLQQVGLAQAMKELLDSVESSDDKS
jgi:hypothetical protein|tara:strand:- start:442 stop:711 length:270 start_codon:yes stop_codon:yes gene_type:complete